MAVNTNRRQVFYDPKGRRKKGLRLTWIILGVTATALVTIFVSRVITLPAMPQLNLKAVESSSPDTEVKSQSRKPLSNNAAWQKMALQTRASKPLALGFYVNWDNSSYLSLQRNLAELDVLVPQWVRLQESDEPVVSEIDEKALDLVRSQKPNIPIIPLIHNSNEGKWNVPALVHALENEASRQKVISAIARLIADNNWNGICVDFELVPTDAQRNLLLFMRELHALFRQRGLMVMEAVPFDDPDWNYRAHAEANDYLLLMAYDEHWAESKPGSVCSQPWFQNMLKRRMSELAPEKTIICIGGYGYEWHGEGKKTTVITFREAM
ncbi:MAG: hypothetical protein J2P31_09130, partial [Blastocatellia bacterium]|nr:hypothetical protein [Blastocatellia bacterium]